MKHLGLLLFCAATTFVVTGSAQAAPNYRVIQWDISRMCQIYDFPSNYRILTPPMANFGTALRAKEILRQRGACLI